REIKLRICNKMWMLCDRTHDQTTVPLQRTPGNRTPGIRPSPAWGNRAQRAALNHVGYAAPVPRPAQIPHPTDVDPAFRRAQAARAAPPPPAPARRVNRNTASARLAARVLRRIRATWDLTVPELITKDSAIWPLLLPMA